MMDHMDRKTRKQLPGVTARRRKGGAGGAPECGGFSRVPRTHTVRVRFMYFYCHPLHPPPFCQKGTTFLGVCSHLSPDSLSHRNHGNHGARALLACYRRDARKCLRHGLRSGSEAKISVISVNFCVTYIFPRAKIICEICVTKKLPYYLAIWEIVRNFAAETC